MDSFPSVGYYGNHHTQEDKPMRLTEEQLEREIRRAKRFNTAAFIIVLILTVTVLIGGNILYKKAIDLFVSMALIIFA